MEARAAQNDIAASSSSAPVENGVNDESAQGITMDAQTSPTSRPDEAIPAAARLDAASSGSRPQASESTPQTVEVNGEQTQQDNTTLNAPSEADREAQNLDHEPQQGLEDQPGDDHVLEIDDAESDSALGSDTESTTTSIMSSIYRYREEHGRTYHAYKDGKYYLPNDERESSRLDFMHDAFRMTYGGKLYLSPLSKLQNALDIGTGTGIWAIDLADENPECQVTGIDLSPSQPDLVPPNAKFIVDDAEDSWVYREKFDLIHARLMAGSFADWPKLFREAYDNLEPGGWLELQEFELPVRSQDGTHKNTNIHKWGELLCEASRNFGRPMGADVCDLFVQQMQDAGFVDVQQRNFIWPTNAWPKDPFMKELGHRTMINCLDGLEGFCLALLIRGLGWKKEEVDVFVAMVANDFKDRKIHSFIPMPVTFGRKPFDHENTFL